MSFPLVPRGRYAFKAFTLIELLTVIAIIGILAAITLSVSKGVRTRALQSRTKAELAVISQALEAYKRQYGDYPQTGAKTDAKPDSSPDIGNITDTYSQTAVFNALAGKLGPKLTALNGKAFLELSRFSLETTALPNPTNTTAVDNALLDPWGRRYIYVYKSVSAPATWKADSYVLFSAGPDGAIKTSDPTPAGIVDYADADNLDNIYANR
jgi:prepilin-type N-terminal cleavage/methylation domain-containing protein